MRIAYQGEPGAFSEAAAKQLAPDAELVPCKSFEDVFASVEEDSARYGFLHALYPAIWYERLTEGRRLAVRSL